MKKYITPENYFMVSVLLLSCAAVCGYYHLRTAGLILLDAAQVLPIPCLLFLLYESKKEIRRLEEEQRKLRSAN